MNNELSPEAEADVTRRLRRDVPLAPMTTLGLGGSARYFVEACSADELRAGVAWARTGDVPVFVLGGGSNIIVADSGFQGLVLRVALRGVTTRIEGDSAIVTAAAGEEWDALVANCVARNWAGFECLSGIPGLVGATPIQNVGAYGQETSETLIGVEALNLETGKLDQLDASQCEFGYRTSRFKTRDSGRFIITGVTYKLSVNGPPAVRYPELERYLAEGGADKNTTLQNVRDAVLAIRRRKAMVIDPADNDSRSVGSFFVNPTVAVEKAERIKAQAAQLGSASAEMPAFPIGDNRVKLSAAWLIEQTGIARGYVHGNVGTSSKHALAIVNRGGGTARELLELKEMIQSRVLGRFGILLAPEPVFVGF